MSNPRESGCLGGNAKHRYPIRWDLKLSESWRIRNEVEDYDPKKKYTNRQLLLIAEKILLTDSKPHKEDPVILCAEALLRRSKREIFVGDGVAKEHVQSGIYWRTHPQGRKWRTPEEMKTQGASFYRDS